MSADFIPDALRHFDSLPAAAHVRQPVVEALFGISASTVWRRVQAGTLPKPFKHGPRTTTWRVGDLRDVLSTEGGSAHAHPDLTRPTPSKKGPKHRPTPTTPYSETPTQDPGTAAEISAQENFGPPAVRGSRIGGGQ